MSALRRWSLLTAVVVGVLAIVAGSVRAAPTLTPGEGATEQLFYLVLVPAIAIGVFVMVLVVYAVLKFRVRPGHTAGPIVAKTHDRKLETLWTVIPAVILLVVGIAAFQTLLFTDTVPPNPDVIVHVIARQWDWSFSLTYPANNTTTAVQAGGFTVKVGQVVKLVFASVDVAHSFWIPAFEVKMDVIPGHVGPPAWFQALVPGNYEVHCAEFCGLNHWSMVAIVHVTPA